MRKFKGSLTAAAFTFAVAGAQAHPGHSFLDHGFAHTMTSPVHILTLAGIGAALFGLAQVSRLAKAKAALRIAGAAALIVAAALQVAA